MKCFLVYVKEWDYDQYDSVAVLADSEEEVRNMFIRKTDVDFPWWDRTYVGKDGPYFEDNQGEIFIEEMTEKGVICASFNAG